VAPPSAICSTTLVLSWTSSPTLADAVVAGAQALDVAATVLDVM
jgi:hypothetical protein